MSQLTNQIAVVTGGGRGIGRAIALKFANEGADVVVVSRTQENSEKVAAEIRALGRKAWAFAVDVADATAVNAAAEKILAEAGKVFSVHNTGWLLDGTKFDSSRDKKPLSFEQGKRKVIPGWDAGFEGMRVGGKRRLFIPYQLAYGEKGRGKIPPKAELIFDVELMDVQDPPAEATPPR